MQKVHNVCRKLWTNLSPDLKVTEGFVKITVTHLQKQHSHIWTPVFLSGKNVPKMPVHRNKKCKEVATAEFWKGRLVLLLEIERPLSLSHVFSKQSVFYFIKLSALFFSPLMLYFIFNPSLLFLPGCLGRFLYVMSSFFWLFFGRCMVSSVAPSLLFIFRCASTIYEHVLICRMIFHDDGNWPHLHVKSQTFCTGWPHRRVIWSKHMGAHNETIFSMRVFLRVVGLGTSKKCSFQKLLFSQNLQKCSSKSLLKIK